MAASRPRMVVISTTFLPFAKQIDAMAAWVKAHAPGAVVVAGGIQVWKSYRHKLLMEAGEIEPDVRAAVCEHNYLMDPTRPTPLDGLVVSPNGEVTLEVILDRLRDGRDVSTLPNTAWFRDGCWRLNPVAEDAPREVRMDWGAFLGQPTRAWVPVQAGVGCASRCAFCDFRGLRPVGARRPESVVDEIGAIPSVDGVRRVYFTDDNLFSSAGRARDVCGLLVRRRMGVRWRGMLRVDIVTDEIAALMAESGCVEVLLGIESGDPDILRAMNKRASPERILEGIESLARHGIHTKSMFIVGYPGENDRSVANTVALLNAYPVQRAAAHRYLFFTFAVLPLSSAASASSRAAFGLRGYGYHWKHATMDSAEASERMAAMQDAIRPELSPSYVQEVPELNGVGADGIKAVYRARNLIARRRRGLAPEVDEDACWRELAAVLG